MAKLTKAHQELQLSREKEKIELLKKKAEAQQNKVRYGESWRNNLTMEMMKETEFSVGSKETPKIEDIVDIYKFFDPIIIYREGEEEPFKFDYNDFLQSEKKYKKTIEKLDKELEEFKNNKKETENIDENSDKSEKQIEQLEEEEINKDEDLEDEEKISKKFLNRNYIVSKYFNRLVPLYNKYTCSCCGKNMSLSFFYRTTNLINSGRMDVNGNYHMTICKDCLQKLFMYYYVKVCKKDLDKTMKYMCADLNLYYDPATFESAQELFEKSGRKGTLIGTYINEINRNFENYTFKDSPFLTEDYYENEKNKIKINKEYAPLDWTKEEAKNKKDVVHLLGYDPFEYEDDDDDRKILYADLVSILDEDIQQDYVKLQSALTIVKSFTKVRHLDERMHQMELEDAPLNEQKAVADLKAKELKAISDFSRDSGFSERFKTRQSQGQTSFTGIVKQMNEKQYEDELINKYDVQTSSTIQAAADASFKAIFNQLNLSDAEVYKIAAEQLAELRKVKQENEKLKEQLRREKYKVSQAELKEEAREKGLEVYDD